jgi:hypothetical protein
MMAAMDVGSPFNGNSVVMQMQYADQPKERINFASNQPRLIYQIGSSSRNMWIADKLTLDAVTDSYQARTPLGKRLLALRRAFVQEGGVLLDSESLDSEVRSRRGGAQVY